MWIMWRRRKLPLARKPIGSNSGPTSLRDLAHQAEKTCPVSNAFRNNFEIIVEPTLAT